ncbi:MAG: peptide chain release factor 1 [Alphaproteobacteria bacterium]|nr:peptide chain release factor 1 [Alphaproteobacteria bacterium]
MSLSKKLQAILERFKELEAGLEKAYELDVQTYTNLTKEVAEIRPIAEKIIELQNVESELADLKNLLDDPNTTNDFKEMADDEYQALRKKLPELEHETQILLLPKDPIDEKNAILEVRAGTGGEEAALFAAELFRMYQRYAEIKGWRFEVLNFDDTGIGGIKDASATIAGQGVFGRLKYESGVHRVQRIPKTESGGRIHTSAATVAVLSEAEDIDVHIEEKDLRIDVFRSSGPGGQSVNTTDSAVRITHIPTGIVVQQQDEKSQHKNKAKALKILRARIFEVERQKVDQERAQSRKSQIGSGDRSERIRTYNFPQGRVSDHRINLTLYKIDQVMEGSGLDEFIDALTTEDQAQKLAEASE